MRPAMLLAPALVASCYSPHPQLGVPCTPELANCPSGETCSLIAGDYFCTPGILTDGGTRADTGTDGTPADAPRDGAMLVPWTLVQTRSQMSNQLGLSSTGAGHLIVVALQTPNTSGATAVTDNAGNIYLPIVGSRATHTGNPDLGVELWYAQNAKAGATKISPSAATVFSVTAWEVAGISTTAALDKARQLSNQASADKPSGPSIATAAPGEFVVSIAIVATMVSGLTNGSAFTNDHTTFGNGFAHLTSNSAPAGSYQATWLQPTAAIYCATAVAFFTGP